MDPFDPAIQSTASYGWEPLITLGLFAMVGAFFAGALYTAIKRGIKGEGWIKKDD